jgi:acetyl esterase/lipase
MNDGELTAAQIATLTASVDIDAPPPGTQPSALVLFGTNQTSPAHIAADRYHRGLAPLIIATGGINRHNGIVEGREFARQLAAADVPASAVRIEEQSKDTWQNVKLSLPYLREALAMGLPLVVVSKWFHLRHVQRAPQRRQMIDAFIRRAHHVDLGSAAPGGWSTSTRFGLPSCPRTALTDSLRYVQTSVRAARIAPSRSSTSPRLC